MKKKLNKSGFAISATLYGSLVLFLLLLISMLGMLATQKVRMDKLVNEKNGAEDILKQSTDDKKKWEKFNNDYEKNFRYYLLNGIHIIKIERKNAESEKSYNWNIVYYYYNGDGKGYSSNEESEKIKDDPDYNYYKEHSLGDYASMGLSCNDVISAFYIEYLEALKSDSLEYCNDGSECQTNNFASKIEIKEPPKEGDSCKISFNVLYYYKGGDTETDNLNTISCLCPGDVYSVDKIKDTVTKKCKIEFGEECNEDF